MKNKIKYFIVGLLVVLLCCFASWIFTCAIIKLITMCLMIEFSLKWATGIWLVMILIKGVLDNHEKLGKVGK